MLSSPPRRAALAAIGFTILAWLATQGGAGVLVYPSAVVFTALALPPALGLTTRILASLSLLFATSFALLLVGLPLLAPLLSAAWLLPSTAVVMRRGWRASLGRVNAEDGWALLVAAVCAAILLAPWATREVSGQLAYMQPGEDNASHLALVSAIRDAGGLVFRADSAPGLMPGLQKYPQGVHSHVAGISELVYGGGAVTVPSAVQSYSFAILFAYGVMTVALAMLAMTLARVCGAASSGRGVAAAGVAALTLGGPVFSLVSFGFFPQIAAYAALALLCVVATDPVWAEHPWARLSVAVACLALIGSSYYFVLPVGALAVTAMLVSSGANRRQRLLWTGAVALAVSLLALPIVLTSLGSGASNALNAVGGVRFLDRPKLAVAVVISALLLFRAREQQTVGRVAGWAAAVAGATLFSYAIGEYQLNTAGQYAYYFFKSLYTIELLAGAGVAAAGAIAFGVVKGSGRIGVPVVSALGLGCFLYIQSGHVDNELHKTLYAAQFETGFDAALAARSELGLEPVVFWGFGTALDDYNRNRQLGAIYLQDEPARSEAVLSAFREQPPRILAGLANAGRPLTVLTRAPDLAAQLRDAGLDSSVLMRTRFVVVP